MKSEYMCRCCLSETCFKDISNEYVYGDHREVYADMLLNTFNINISYQESNSRLICEDCIVRLRDAAAFKKQVEDAEDAFLKKMFNKVVLNIVAQPKIECQDEFLDYITGDFDSGEDDEDCDDIATPLDDELEVMQNGNNENTIVLKVESTEDLDDIPLLQRMKCKNKIAREKGKRKEKSKATIQKRVVNNSDLNRKTNSIKLITNSNMCLFDSLKIRFRCFYCKNSYLTMKELREHFTTHSDDKLVKTHIIRLKGASKFVDISDLKCKICSENLTNLATLQEHLTENHNIEFSGNENLLIPFKLSDGFKCVLCEVEFNNFYKLLVHTNSHYHNHVCEVCGASYISRISLRLHVRGTHRQNKCSICDAVFANTYSRAKHMRKVHNFSESKRYCLLCNKTFRYTYLLEEHKIQEHGMKRPTQTCPECGKVFAATVNLRTHMRCVHLRERTHACARCHMAFFTSCDLRRHQASHLEHRLFSCNYCEGRFKTKDSLRRHLKRQHGNFISNPGNTA